MVKLPSLGALEKAQPMNIKILSEEKQAHTVQYLQYQVYGYSQVSIESR